MCIYILEECPITVRRLYMIGLLRCVLCSPGHDPAGAVEDGTGAADARLVGIPVVPDLREKTGGRREELQTQPQ